MKVIMYLENLEPLSVLPRFRENSILMYSVFSTSDSSILHIFFNLKTTDIEEGLGYQ
jgi:hypothetical protein